MMESCTIYPPWIDVFVNSNIFFVHPAIPIKALYMQQQGTSDIATWPRTEPDASQPTEEK